MFAFCRFIKVFDQKGLVDSLSNIWIKKLRLHANMARFDRKLAVKPSHVGATVHNSRNINLRLVGNSVKVSSYANATKASVGGRASSGLSLALIECYKDFRAIGVLSWFSLLKPWHDDFVVKDRLIWLELEGVPLLAWNNDTFKKIGSRWGEEVSYAMGLESYAADDKFFRLVMGIMSKKNRWIEYHSKQHDSKDADDNGINTVDTDPFELADLIARKCNKEFSAVRKPEVQEEATKASVLRDSVTTETCWYLNARTIGSDDQVKVDQNIATREELIDRATSMKIVGDIDRKEASDLAQKAKIKWAIEGDENTSFFRGTLKKKRRQNAIKGVLKNGIWIEDPGEVKAEFYDHFRSRFSCTSGDRPCIGDVPLNRLSCQQRDFLESDF
ncbi:hypothetical protein Tco_0728465 [Tanacetum coccineum]|uniref:DUF4283 domain-containing protein n=1 Tax=Tanacetum coccineum TaxID=301880 RepID=A0ABQ4YL80_9ASTR